LDHTPFEVLYGYPPRLLGIDVADAASVLDLQQWLAERELMHSLVRLHLRRAQDRMRRQANKHRSECSFDVGDLFFLKIQPYVQASVARRVHHKLSFKFFGPYCIPEKIGAVAYKLDLPSTASVHPIFHVSQLKCSLGGNQVSSTLSSDLVMYQVLEQILQRRWTSSDHPVEEVFVKCVGVVPNSLQDIGRASDGAKRRPVKAVGWAGA
jgi:hypothetical protein